MINRIHRRQGEWAMKKTRKARTWCLPDGVTALVYVGNHNFRVSPWFEVRGTTDSRTLPADGYYCILDRATGTLGPRVESPPFVDVGDSDQFAATAALDALDDAMRGE